MHFSFCFFADTATPEIYTLSLHDALPISRGHRVRAGARALYARDPWWQGQERPHRRAQDRGAAARWDADRKSTRLNSSHTVISYAVFCLKKKTTTSRSIEGFQGPPRRTSN